MTGVAARIARFPLSKAAAVFAVAQLADLATALNVTRELNPIVNALAAMPGAGQLIKVALIVFVIAVARVADGRRPVLARLLLAFGAVAGLVGAFTNTPFTPFVS